MTHQAANLEADRPGWSERIESNKSSEGCLHKKRIKLRDQLMSLKIDEFEDEFERRFTFWVKC